MMGKEHLSLAWDKPWIYFHYSALRAEVMLKHHESLLLNFGSSLQNTSKKLLMCTGCFYMTVLSKQNNHFQLEKL